MIDAAKPLADLADAYEVNKQTVKAINAELEKEIIKVNTSSNNLLNTILTLLALLGLLILFLIWYFGKRQAQTINSAVMMLENDGQQNQMAVLNLLDAKASIASTTSWRVAPRHCYLPQGTHHKRRHPQG